MSITDAVILGIHDGHDAAAAIVQGGKVLCAISEERIQRIKSTGGLPLGAIEECLRFSGLTYKDIDYVALAGTRAVAVNMLGTLSTFTHQDYLDIQEKVRKPQFTGGETVSLSSLFPNYKPKGDIHYPLTKLPLKETREMSAKEKRDLATFRHQFVAEACGVSMDRVLLVDHHTCHAYYAYYSSQRNDFPVTALTMDAGGDGIYDSVNHFDERGNFRRLHSSHQCIVGPLYTYMTLLLGMRPFEHEYKLMGLAPYAKEHTKARSREIFRSFMSLKGIAFTRSSELNDLYWHPRELLKYERFDGIAGGLQDWVEECLSAWVKAAIEITGSGDVVFAGGVSLNVKANKRIHELPSVNKLSIPPGPGDESLPMGAIWAAMDRLNPSGSHRKEIEPLPNGFLGPGISEADISAFAEHPSVVEQYVEVHGDPVDSVATALNNHKNVGLCHGRMEFGPRALGHRSIVANASSTNAVREINDAIKGRDFWMPFAPSILAEHTSDYLCNIKNADLAHMTLCLDSTRLARQEIVAALHPYDHTARPNVVDRDRSPRYHKILSRFREISGLKGVLNTSLNIHGKPIVMRPMDIVEELITEPGVNIDGFLIEDRFFARREA